MALAAGGGGQGVERLARRDARVLVDDRVEGAVEQQYLVPGRRLVRDQDDIAGAAPLGQGACDA